MTSPWAGASVSDVWTFDGITFNNGADVDGVEYIVTSDSGWFSSAPTRNNRNSKPNAPGAYRSPVYKDPRIIAISGYFLAPTPALREAAGYRLSGAGSDPLTLYPLSRSEIAGPRMAYVELDTDTLVGVVPNGDGGLTGTFSMQFAAPDPRKFTVQLFSQTTTMPNPGTGGVKYTGDVTIPNGLPYLGDNGTSGIDYGSPGSGGLLTLNNAGTAPADIFFTITGPVSNPTLYNNTTGQTITFQGSLGASDVLTIDTGSGATLLNGANYRPYLSSAQFFTIPKLSTIAVAYSATTGSTQTTVTAQWRYAYN